MDLMKQDPECAIEGHWALMAARYMVETKDCLLPYSSEDIQNMKDCFVSEEPQAYSFIYAMGYCAIIKKDFKNGEAAIKALEDLKENLKSSQARTATIMNQNEKEFRINVLTISIAELLALQDQVNGKLAAALQKLEPAAEIESKMALPNGIPVPVQSALELYGNFLLQDKQWSKAKSFFLKALDRVPNRAKTYVGLAEAMKGLGNFDGAKKYASQALIVWANADSEFPELKEARGLSQ